MSSSAARGFGAALTILALGACDWAQAPDQSPIPTAPPGPSAPPAADFEGRFTTTFRADNSCGELPEPYRTRTYTASISGDMVGRYKGSLSGTEFFSPYDAFMVTSLPVGGMFSIHSPYAYDKWLDEVPVYERLPSGGYLAISGVARVPIQKSDISISAALDGTFSYCARAMAAASGDLPPSCAQPIDCRSGTHTLTLSRQ